MPRKKKSNLSTVSRDTKRKRVYRAAKVRSDFLRDVELVRLGSSCNPTVEGATTSVITVITSFDRKPPPLTSRERVARFRARQSEAEKEKRLAKDRVWHSNFRKAQSQDDKEARLAADRNRHSLVRKSETEQEKGARLAADRERHRLVRKIKIIKSEKEEDSMLGEVKV